MIKKELVIVLLACISLLVSCGKNPFSNGEVMEYDRQLEHPFNTVAIYDNFNITLIHSDISHPSGMIHIKTGENLIDGIFTDIDGDTLVIRNDNNYSYLRPYDYTREMTVYYDSLYQILLHSNAECFITDTLHGHLAPTHFTHSDSDTIGFDSLVSNLYVEIQGGSGDFNLLANCFKVTVKYLHGTSSINIKGKTYETSVYGDYDSHGIIDCSELESEHFRVTYFGTNTVYGKAFNRFTAINDNIGRIYYAKYKETRKKIIWGHYQPGTYIWIPADTIDTLYYCPISLIREGSNRDNILPFPMY